MKPLVSILIPAYNSEAWIADTVQSALNQTWERKEIIIVDDGSSDKTLFVARQFASKQVSVVTQLNQGAASTRNKAYDLSQGNYIQWLDADDVLAPDKVQKQMEAIEKCESKRTLFSAEWGRFCHRVHKATFAPSALWHDLSRTEWLQSKMGKNLHMQTATWLTSRELAQAAGPWDTRLTLDDDGEYFCRVLLASDGVRFVPDAKVYYRDSGPGRLSHVDFSSKKLESQLLSMQLHVKYLLSLEDSDRSRAACLFYLNTWLIYFFPQRPDMVKRLEVMAAELGGKLELPALASKYAWIEKLFGWNAAKWAQLSMPRIKTRLEISWDKTLSKLENRSAGSHLHNRSF